MGVQINGDTGNVIATKGTYSGNVTIGGTLTYEDVTNVDSIGIVTARNGIEVGASPGVAASISVDGNAIFSGITTVATLRATTGIVTAFQGDIVIEDKIIHSGDTNTNIRFPDADTITAETGGSERLRITSSGSVGIGTETVSGAKLDVIDGFINVGAAVTTADARIQFTRKDTGIYSWVGIPTWNPNAFYIYGPKDSSPYNEAAAIYESSIWSFRTAGSLTLQIDSSGYVTKPTNLCLSYTASASTDYSSGTIIYNTEVFDVGNSDAYNTSTGVFTAPVDGMYSIYHEYYAHTNNKAMTEIQKSTNGGGSFSAIKYGPRVQGTSSDYSAVSCTFLTQLNANDQIKIIRREGTIHINNTYTHFQVQLVQ